MPPDAATFVRRRFKLNEHFSAWGIDALLISGRENILYLTGFSGTDAAAVITGDRVFLLVDGRYITAARETVRGAEIIEIRDLMDGVAEALSAAQARRIGFDSAVLTVHTHKQLLKALHGEVLLLPLSEELVMLRAVKDEHELACMRKAAAIASGALLAIQQHIRPGVTEQDIALELDFRMRRDGADEISFPTIVASGKNSALPHASPSSRRIEAGDVVVIDYGAVLEGYHSDETCTFFVGFADPEARQVYARVLEAHDLAIAELRTGAACRDVDRIVRDSLGKAGLSTFFSHGTGHGVGLDVHEAPRLNSRSTAILEAGMVVTIEPGVYLPGRWGIRIEDTALVRDDGCEIFTKMPKTLTILN